MRVTQGYVSKSVMDFPFHEVYALDDYNDVNKAAIFFGMYRFEDWCLADQHLERITPLIFWTGQDALNERTWPKQIGHNITAHVKVKEHFDNLGFQCQLIKPAAWGNTVNPNQLGPKIYAYCPSSTPEYHGKKIIDQLIEMGYNIIIGDGRHTQQEWKHARNAYYNDIFIGLCLSEFAGGGGSIIEMGLRGVNVITNVFTLPNCLPFESIDDVVNLIEQEKKEIGTVNEKLASDVWKDLDHDHKWMEI